MKYGELFHFDPIDAIIQLRKADAVSEAEALVDSYVISDDIADRLTLRIIPQLQFLRDADNKGVLIVGNYGSGKSHLLAVLSAVAEHATLAQKVRHESVRQAMGEIAGRFRVLRLELGTTKMSLRDILCAHVEEFLAKDGITFQFPTLEQVSGYKRAFEDLMAAFNARHPDKGLLLVVDELLDYLRQRDDFGFAQDLSFLREIGESCRDLRLRFVAGLQERLFENERFNFVSAGLQRVKDRFEQVMIAKSDVRFVIAHRLLQKTSAQRSRIEDYLRPFIRYFPRMGPEISSYVDLFPIHPEFIDVFERVSMVEKRMALLTISAIVRAIQGDEVPEDRPGIVSYDRFWERLLRDPTQRTVPGVRDVLDCGKVLEERVLQNIRDPEEQRFALRIIAGLGVQRLTTGDIDVPIGVTAAELRDGLCLYNRNVENLTDTPADDLRDAVTDSLQQIQKVVSGQFIGHNPDNDQYFIDVKKTVDYDKTIERRAESLSPELLDRHWFAVLRVAMECSDKTLVTGLFVWPHEIEWRERRAARQGYLLFGAPNERPTAQPPRDFYLYFMQPWKPPHFKDEKLPEEVFFRLATPHNDDMLQQLRRFAAATELAAGESGNARRTYEGKAGEAQRKILEFVRANLGTAFTVTHRGHSRPLGELLKKAAPPVTAGARFNLRDYINAVASHLFAEHFEKLAPEYPTFPTLVTVENRERAVVDALRALKAGGGRGGRGVLEALKLFDGDKIVPAASPYAAKVLATLKARPAMQVINRAELIAPRDGVEYDTSFRLEPEWFVVVLAALVYSGDITLAVGGRKFDAGDLDALIATPVDLLVDFKHIERPRGWNRAMLGELSELVGLGPGVGYAIADGNAPEERFREICASAQQILKSEVNEVEARIRGGLSFWNTPILSESALHDVQQRIRALRDTLDTLLNLRGVGQLKNVRWGVEDVQARRADRALVHELQGVLRTVDEHGAAVAWVILAESALRDDDPWVKTVVTQRREAVSALEDPARRAANDTRLAIGHSLRELQDTYRAGYIAAHQRHRLGPNGQERRAALRADGRLARLARLARLPIFSAEAPRELSARLDALRDCEGVTTQDLRSTPLCPNCGFRPVAERPVDPMAVLQQVGDALDARLDAWHRALDESLKTPAAKRDIALLDGAHRGAIEVLLANGAADSELNDDTMEALAAILRGLLPVPLNARELRRALLPGRAPATVSEIKARFRQWLDAQCQGKDEEQIRFVVDEREDTR